MTKPTKVSKKRSEGGGTQAMSSDELTKALMEVESEVLKTGEGFLRVLKKKLLQFHPDKVEGKQAVFRELDHIHKLMLAFLNRKTVTNVEKVELALELKQLKYPAQLFLAKEIIKIHPRLTLQELISPKAFLIKQISYKHYVEDPDAGRFHFFAVDSKNFKTINEIYQGFEGDYLKSEILANFKGQLEETTSAEELKKLVKTLEKSDEYKVLATGQGVITKVFKLKTSSVEAFEKMVTEQENNFKINKKSSLL